MLKRYCQIFILFALFTVNVIFIPKVNAEITTYDGIGEYVKSSFESQENAELKAKNEAIKNAQDKAGIYVRSYSKAIKSSLVVDDIVAMTNNVLNISDVAYDRQKQSNGDVKIIAILKATFDTDQLEKWLNRDIEELKIIIAQNRNIDLETIKQQKYAAQLKTKYNSASTQAERDEIIRQFNEADKIILSNLMVDEGKRLVLDSSKVDEAKTYYTKAIALNPNNAIAYRCLGDYDKAIELNPNDVLSYYYRGDKYFKLQEYNLAISDFNKAIELAPDYAIPYFIRAQAYDKLKNYNQVIADYTKVINIYARMSSTYVKFSPTSRAYQSALNNRGIAYTKLGQYEKAVADYTTLIEEFPDSPSWESNYNGRIGCYTSMGKYDLALADCDTVLKKNPNSSLIKYQLRLISQKKRESLQNKR